jgi:predicted Zn-dependent protease with MMP-like domain
MLSLDDKSFDEIISAVMDELPQQYISGLKNVAIVYENEPSPEQRRKLKLRSGDSLYGLYEGIPLTKRSNGYNLVVPDKITIFKKPFLEECSSVGELRAKVKHTLWHEIAHYYGLDHDRIEHLENGGGHRTD